MTERLCDCGGPFVGKREGYHLPTCSLIRKEPMICDGLTDDQLEAGEAAWDKANHDLENYVSGVTPDWDRSMIVAAIFKAMLTQTSDDRDTLVQGLRDTAKWIQDKDPLATNYLFCLQAAALLSKAKL